MQDERIKHADTGSVKGHERKIPTSVLAVFGMGLIVATGALGVCGVKSAVDAINRAEYEAAYAMQQQADEAKTTMEQQTVHNWSDEQTKWMTDNYITYDEYGLPIDENGNVIDDPTTKTNETEYIESRRNAVKDVELISTDTDTETEITPEKTMASWIEGKDWIMTDDEGRYYYQVKKGDTLCGIARVNGFSTDALRVYNNINSDGIIEIGQIIYFPAGGPSAIQLPNTGLG